MGKNKGTKNIVLRKIMKKILVLVLTLALNMNLCFATTKLTREQVPEFKNMAQHLLNKINNKPVTANKKTYKQYIIDMYKEDCALYNDFLANKNIMKRNNEYVEKFMQNSATIDTLADSIYKELNPILNKYGFIEEDIAKQGANTFEYLYRNYFKKYKIQGYEEFKELFALANNTQNTILDLRQAIIQYSKSYETSKAQNFYKNNIMSKVEDLPTVLLQNFPLNVNKIYLGRMKVIHIYSNGFLADVGPNMLYNRPVLYVQSNQSQKLVLGDSFFPFMPLKFTGQYKTYTTMANTRNTVPIFREMSLSEYRNSIPKIQEPFYFTDKPQYDIDISSIQLVNEYVGAKTGNPYRSWR